MSWKPEIYAFIDYRAYLRAYYEAAKEHESGFSYRSFAVTAGLSSQSFLRDVIRGDKNIGSSATAICKAIGLLKAERNFFDLLVAFDRAEGRLARNELFEQIAATRRFQQARRLDEGMYRYLSQWYVPALRELVTHEEFDPDPAWIAKTMRPKVTEAQAREALELLLDLGFITETDGRYEQADPTITTGHEVTSLGVENYHHEMLRLAGESIQRFASTQRDIAAMTVCVAPDDVSEIKRRIHAFRESVLAFADASPGGTVVMQFNSQLFPLSKVDE